MPTAPSYVSWTGAGPPVRRHPGSTTGSPAGTPGPPTPSWPDDEVVSEIRAIHARSRGAYGWPDVVGGFRQQGRRGSLHLGRVYLANGASGFGQNSARRDAAVRCASPRDAVPLHFLECRNLEA